MVRILRTLLVGSMLVAVVGIPVAAAEGEDGPPTPAFMTGKLKGGDVVSWGESADPEGFGRTEGVTFGGLTVKASDPRMAGNLTITYNQDAYKLPPGSDFSGIVGLQSGSVDIRGEGQGWTGSLTALVSEAKRKGKRAKFHWDLSHVLLVGDGTNEGLGAYIVLEVSDDPDFTSGTIPFRGVIYEGDLPLAPTAPIDEEETQGSET
jgi:hypothetical protein